jgi:hypothetical protein
MSPAAFAQRPLSWIAMLSDVRATFTIVPNFAYELAVDALQGARSFMGMPRRFKGDRECDSYYLGINVVAGKLNLIF